MQSQKQKPSPEQQLADYWSKRVKNSEFTKLLIRDAIMCRPDATMQQARASVGEMIMRGQPLLFAEYHLALASYYLLGEIPYLEFFKKRWHETDGHRGYGPTSTCELCARERKEKKWKAKQLTA